MNLSIKPVVLLQHGLTDSSDAWVVGDASVAPAFVLVENGYDVWLANSRGNKYSKGYAGEYISNADYWKFTIKEMADYDLPAMIDYILLHTKQKKLAFIGHSSGTT